MSVYELLQEKIVAIADDYEAELEKLRERQPKKKSEPLESETKTNDDSGEDLLS